MVESDIYDRDLLLAGDRFSGPAIVEQMDCTTVVPPGATVTVDEYRQPRRIAGSSDDADVAIDARGSVRRANARDRRTTAVPTPPRAIGPAMDPVTFEVIRNAMVNITEEMAVTIRRAAFSTNIKTRADFSCAFFDTQLRCIAQSFAQPAHLVAMSVIAPNAIREIGPENFKAGRFGLRQRPAPRLQPPQRHHRHHARSMSAGSGSAMSPTWRTTSMSAARSRRASASTARSSRKASSCRRRWSPRGGKIDDNVLKLILANIRAPRETNGDLRAQLSANVVGSRRMETLTERYGRAVIEAFFDELIAYTERWTDREIRKLPEGAYEAEGFRDDDGITDDRCKLHAKVTIRDGHVRLDVSGSDEQRPCPINCNRAMSRTAAVASSRAA